MDLNVAPVGLRIIAGELAKLSLSPENLYGCDCAADACNEKYHSCKKCKNLRKRYDENSKADQQ
jgi:hypothetical protein